VPGRAPLLGRRRQEPERIVGTCLQGTQIIAAGLEHLKGLTVLRTLDLVGTQVTDAGVQQLEQSLPNLRIRRRGSAETWIRDEPGFRP